MIEGYDNKFLQTFDYETTAISNKKIIGTCELGKATIQLLNESNDFSDLKETWIKTKFGSFYIYNVEPVQEKINIKLSCYDVKYKLDTEYDSSLYAWPLTLKEWRNAIFTNCNVLFDNSDFPNSDLELDREPNIEGLKTNRQVLCFIAQAGASWIETDETDKFYFKWFTNTTHNIDDWTSLTTEKTPTKSINLVVLGRGDVEDIVYYPKTKPQNPIEFKIDSNYILDPQDVTTDDDLRETTIIPIYNRVNGFKFIIYKLTTMQVSNKLSIKLGDKIKYVDTWGNELESYVMKRKISYIGGDIDDDNNYQIELSAEAIEETNSNLKLGVDVVKKISELGVKVDKNNETIQILNKSINENTENLSEIMIKSDSIASTVSSIKENYDDSNSKIEVLEKDVTRLQTDTYTKTEINTKLTDGSVTKVQTTSGTFDEDGMHYEKTGAKTSSTINQSGVSVENTQSNDELLFAGYDEDLKDSVVRTNNIYVTNFTVYNDLIRVQKYGDKKIGFFYVGK